MMSFASSSLVRAVTYGSGGYTYGAYGLLVRILRLGGALSSVLLCIHSTKYLFTYSTSSWQMIHNFADLSLLAILGVCGLVAELCPRDSAVYKTLKTNMSFMNSMIGRALFYILFGMLVTGNFSNQGQKQPCRAVLALSASHGNLVASEDESDGEPRTAWGYFCVASGIFIQLVGLTMLVVAIRNRYRGSPATTSGTALQSDMTAPMMVTPSPAVVEVPLASASSDGIKFESINSRRPSTSNALDQRDAPVSTHTSPQVSNASTNQSTGGRLASPYAPLPATV